MFAKTEESLDMHKRQSWQADQLQGRCTVSFPAEASRGTCAQKEGQSLSPCRCSELDGFTVTS